MFDTKEFVDSVIAKGRSLDEIVVEARVEIDQTESSSHRVRGAPANRVTGSGDHVRFLGALVFFLQSGTMPAGISDDDFQLLQRLTKYLVEQGTLKATILELFSAASED